MIYIIGIDHLVQYNGPLPETILAEFKQYIEELIREYNITIIAEEFNEEFLTSVYGATEDTAKAVAEKTGISHIYCDPDEKERMELGIPYYADMKDKIKDKYGITQKFIMDHNLRKQIDEETIAEVKKFWGIRERFWFESISGRLCENILFLCGYEHTLRFRDLLISEGVRCLIIDEFWRSDLFNNYRNLGLR